MVLVGTSATGKTRACWEAVQPLASRGWRLWHPFDPTRAEAALEELQHVRPKTVVWLNEAQHYLGDPRTGERIAAQIHHLLTRSDRIPVLVLGTLWPEYAHQYSGLAQPGRADRHSRTRELLAGRTITVPDTFGPQALDDAAALATRGDRLLADALTRARRNGRLAQELAGVPELLVRYQTGSPGARAVLEAAMDARRLGVGLNLPQAFLTDAATDYLTDHDYSNLAEDWAEQTYAELAHPVHGKQAPLSRTNRRPTRRLPGQTAVQTEVVQAVGPAFRLADYLEQHGRETRRLMCPPASFWHASYTHLTHSPDLDELARAAQARHRLQWAHHLRQKAADAGDLNTLFHLAGSREQAGDLDGAEAAYRQAADAGGFSALLNLAQMKVKAGDCKGADAAFQQAADAGLLGALTSAGLTWREAGHFERAEAAFRKAADMGDTGALLYLAGTREKAGDLVGAEAVYREAADAGEPYALPSLAWMRAEAGDMEGAEALYREAADTDEPGLLIELGLLREKAEDLVGAEALYRQAAEADVTQALFSLARLRQRTGDLEGAEVALRQAADAGETDALYKLAQMWQAAGNLERAQAAYRQASDNGVTHALISLAQVLEKSGDLGGAEVAFRQAADAGESQALLALASMLQEAGDLEGAEVAFRQAADAGERLSALIGLAKLREKAEDLVGAEALYRHAVGIDATHALRYIGLMWQRAGDQERADAAFRQAADAGSLITFDRAAAELFSPRDKWPYGLDPDGSPTAPW
ncbi:hypothetical protein ABZ471_44465 [Streptomyces sp. NPDC005728]|uniref:tetratricopeptide repeat protein n=1 Tax=Streptomyces sp. NPDC005728 TaxID=3157054 RepID=UPI0033EF4925